MARRRAQVCSATLSWLVPGRDRHGDLVRGGGFDVDQVVADAGPGDHAQFRGEREQIGRHPLSAGDQGVDFAQKRQKLFSRQREVTLRVDHFEAGVLEDLPKAARLVPQQIGTDQNSGHGHLGVSKGIFASNRALSTHDWRRFLSFGRRHRPCVGPLPNLFSSNPEGNLVSPPLFRVRSTSGGSGT